MSQLTLTGRVLAFAVRHRLWADGVPVVAAVSGGADSTALLLVLHELAEGGHVNLAGVAHLHHHIRASDADLDAAFVERLAVRLGLSLALEHADVPALARRAGRSLEVAGREARLAFFERLASAPMRPLIALAHTRSDQAETVILRLARGAGPRGLAGMAPSNGSRVRPLLDIDREQLRVWLRERDEPWREDNTNVDATIARNRVRHAVLPQLAELNPAVEEALARAARIQAADAELLDQLATAEAGRHLAVAGEAVTLDRAGLSRLPEALARRVIRRALTMAHPGHTPDWDATEAVLHASVGPMSLGPVRVELFGESAVLSSRVLARTRRADVGTAVTQTLEVPGTLRHPSGWWQLEAAGPTLLADAAASREAFLETPDSTQAVLDATALGRHLTIRAWRPGDRVQPLGLGGRKKLQDVFVDRKVPRDERPRVPVVVDAQGRIAWVAGHVVGEPFRVTPRSEAVVILTLRQ